MITLNNKRFAADDTEFTNSLFNAGGTCSGYYKRLKDGSIAIMDMQKNRIGVINKAGVMGRCDKKDNGRYWYSYGDIDIIGRYESYAAQVNEAQAALHNYHETPDKER